MLYNQDSRVLALIVAMPLRHARGAREADDNSDDLDQQEPDEVVQEEAADDTEEVERPVRLEIESDDLENEENLHERMQRHRYQQPANQQHQHQPQHHPHHHHHHHQHHGHVKEMIKSDRSIRVARGPSPSRQPSASKIVATAVDEEQLHQRLLEAKSSDVGLARRHSGSRGGQQQPNPLAPNREQPPSSRGTAPKLSGRSASSSSSSSSSASSTLRSTESDGLRSPPPAAIIIPASVAKSLSARASSPSGKSLGAPGVARSATQSAGPSSPSSGPTITREQLDYGLLLRNGEVQVLYRNPEADNRTAKDEEAKRVAPGQRQSPIAIMSMNPTYELVNKALVIEYPAIVENLRLNNTGFSWEVKIPYQISMVTALYGAHLNQAHRFRLDQFHCHWGERDEQGSEHTVDNRAYSAELHFVHYNMEKYHSMAKAARHPDGLVVVGVFLEAHPGHHNHAELEKIVSHLRAVSLKGEHSIIKQAIRIENLLPANKSYWSYQGSLTTPPYFESVTWFMLKHPIKCSAGQIQRFRNLNSSLRSEVETLIRSNHRATQPLNGRTIVNYDEPRSR